MKEVCYVARAREAAPNSCRETWTLGVACDDRGPQLAHLALSACPWLACLASSKVQSPLDCSWSPVHLFYRPQGCCYR